MIPIIGGGESFYLAVDKEGRLIPNNNIPYILTTELGFSNRTINGLWGGQVYTLQDITEVSEDELIKFVGLGIKCREEIYEVLKAHGYSLRVGGKRVYKTSGHVHDSWKDFYRLLNTIDGTDFENKNIRDLDIHDCVKTKLLHPRVNITDLKQALVQFPKRHYGRRHA